MDSALKDCAEPKDEVQTAEMQPVFAGYGQVPINTSLQQLGEAQAAAVLDLDSSLLQSNASHQPTSPATEVDAYSQNFAGFRAYMGHSLFLKSTSSLGKYLQDRSQLLTYAEEEPEAVASDPYQESPLVDADDRFQTAGQRATTSESANEADSSGPSASRDQDAVQLPQLPDSLD